MASTIVWTDGEGAATLANGFPAPGDRFSGWTLLTTETQNGAGVQRQALGTGITYAWIFRADTGAKFSLRYIPNSDQGLLTRLKRWLESGGVITVETGDSASHTYTACYLWPGSTVEISPPDPRDLRLTVTLSVLNADGDDLICTY